MNNITTSTEPNPSDGSGKDHWFHIVSYVFAGFFAGLAVLISTLQIIKHLRNYTNKVEQKQVVRIIFMVPLYSIMSWLSLKYFHYSVYFATLRDCYEGFVLWSFMQLIIAFLGGSEELITKLEDKPARKLLTPLCCVKFKPNKSYYYWCKRGILQFTFIKPICGVLSLLLEEMGVYNNGKLKFSLESGYTWMSLINNISVTISLYCLLSFYGVMKNDLKGRRAVAKFLCIKGILFFTFWQGLFLALLVKIRIVRDLGSWTSKDVSIGIQDFLICHEMLFFALVHLYAFSASPYIKRKNVTNLTIITDGERVQHVITEQEEITAIERVRTGIVNVGQTIIPTDLIEDTVETIRMKPIGAKGTKTTIQEMKTVAAVPAVSPASSLSPSAPPMMAAMRTTDTVIYEFGDFDHSDDGDNDNQRLIHK